MPTPLPSSFASAAAGNVHDPNKRGDGTTGGEWSRTRMNGATQTFRRPSVATNPSHNRDSSQTTSVSTPTVGAYIPPHMTSNQQPSGLRNGLATGENRYSKDQLLDLYKSQRETGTLGKNMADYFVADWDPHVETAVNGAWGKRDDQKDSATGPEVCWDHGGHVEPLALMDMSDEEKELFSASVNSPLKPPPSNATKDNNQGVGTGARKSSVSYPQSNINNYNTSSPGSARPGPRRRETGDSAGNPMSPTPGGGSRFFRDEPNTSTPPPSLLRRKTDFRDPGSRLEEKDSKDVSEAASPFGSLKRSSTNPLSAGLSGPSSPWASASQSANFSPMGAFGAFSLGPNSASQTPTTEKKPGFGSLRGESRLKGLFSKDSSEDIGASIKEKPSFSNLERLPEGEGSKASQSPWGETVKTRAGRSETNPFAEEPRSGSAALGGSQDLEPPSQAADQLGFSAFGMTPSIPGFRELMQSHENSRNPTPSLLQGHEPTSPTNTNPYQSPHGDRRVDVDDVETDGSDIQGTQNPGISGLRDTSNPFGSIRRVGSGMDLPSIDRSQSSSVAGNRSFSNLGGLGGLPTLGGGGGGSGWPASNTAIGTPTRERSAFSTGFGDPIFGSMGDLQSPSLSTLGGSGLFSPHAGISGTSSLGRSSKLGSLFPTAMQDQMQADQGDEAQQADRSGQTGLPATTSTSQTPVSAVGSIPANISHDVPQPSQTPGQSGSAPGSVPPAQQRTMVMPDRMRWIYRDPQGSIQGPWTGLEMHDWFKAGFFSPDLQIKKLEDPEFEPLAQLVRRIGNSREPFLVPQIGIPHGPDPNATPWGQPPPPSGTAQPPFPGSFPSFGTTLTAEQQNALERRKQEEQYLMARQKEHLAQQQALMKQMQVQGVPHAINPQQLQHQSSAQSLHSQPSFGSITSPVGFQPSPIQAPMQQQAQNASGLLDMRQSTLPNLGPQMLGTDLGSGQDQLPALLDRLNVNRPDPFAFGSPSSFATRQPDSLFHSQQVASMLQDRDNLQQEQEQFDSTHGDSLFDQQAREERLRQFHALRAQEGEFGMRTAEGLPTHPTTAPSQQNESENLGSLQEEAQQASQDTAAAGQEPVLTLSQQVQKAASAQRQQKEQEQIQQEQEDQQQEPQGEAPRESVWNKIDSAMPRPFPPPPSASPLPAPAAQRNRQNVAESLAANSRSQTQTPVEAPATSIAPWAKEANEVPKGPSLKEIQEAEARSAAQKEEVAAAARRAQLLAEQERISQAQAPSPGLPSTANWASAGSPATPTSTTSVWNKQGSQAAPAGGAKKTLAQIQKEEEARKQRLANAAAAAQSAAAATSPPAPSSAGKRYADLASKTPAAPAQVASVPTGAWTTVGAGGKVKAPPAPASPVAPRAVSGNIPITTAAAKPKPAAAPSPRTLSVNTTSPPANPNRAVEEFTKWAKLSLGKGLNSNINVDDFTQQLLLLPAEAEIISDSVYANSATLDGRRFADEFIRRRKLADKGVVEPVSASAYVDQKNGGGWSEVAKKGSSSNVQREPEESSNAAFKVVAPRKKGKR